MNYPQEIEKVSIALESARIEIADMRLALAEIEAGELLAILQAKDPNGKPLYGNEATRQAQLTLALAGNEDYQRLLSQIARQEVEKAALAARLERLRGEFKLYLLEWQREMAVAHL